MYVERLEAEAKALATEAGVTVPEQCVNGACLEMSAYVDMLEQTVAKLRSGDAFTTTTRMGLYIEKLQRKIALLSADLETAVPQQCVGDACLDEESFVDLLETTAASLEAQWRSTDGSTQWGTEVVDDDETSLTGYVSALEGRVARLAALSGVEPPQRCDGDACMEMSAYIELLERSVSELGSGEWKGVVVPSAAAMAAAAPPTASSLTMVGYIESLEAKAVEVSAACGVEPPAQCDGDTCLDLQSYVLLLTSHISKLEAAQATAK